MSGPAGTQEVVQGSIGFLDRTLACGKLAREDASAVVEELEPRPSRRDQGERVEGPRAVADAGVNPDVILANSPEALGHADQCQTPLTVPAGFPEHRSRLRLRTKIGLL